MAYLRSDDETQKNKPPAVEQAKQTSGLLSGYMSAQPLGAAAFSPGMNQAQSLYGAGGSGPNVTGHVNFDSIYAANEGTARRDAAKYGNDARNAAQTARKGLGGLQSQFTSQSVAAQGSGPTQQQRDWAARGSTGVLPGKKVVGAEYAAAPYGATQPVGGDAPGQTSSGNWLKQNFGIDGDLGPAVNAAFNALSPAPPASQPPTQSTVTENQEGLDSGGYLPPKLDENGNPIPGTGYTPQEAPQPGATKGDPTLEAAVRAGAAGKYTGPDSLQDLEGYKGLLGDYGKAERNLSGLQDDAHLQGMLDEQSKGPYIEGGNKLDAALTGAAGREDFARIRDQYKGIGGELAAANKASGAQAATSRGIAEANAGQYQGLLSQYEGRVDADTEAEKKSQAGSDKAIADAVKKRDDQLAYAKAFSDRSDLDKFRNDAHKFANAANPVDWALRATGNKTATEAGTDYYDKQFGGGAADKFNPGNSSPAWGNDDADVFGSMSPEDWTQFNALGLAAQQAWIAERKKKLRGGKG